MNKAAMDWEAKKAARKVAADALAAANPKLVRVGNDWGKNDSLNAAAKNIRIELKAAFPGVKFAVRSSRFSGGDSICVSWVDGPTSAMVDAIIDKYAAGSFNGMEDIYEYSESAWRDAFGDAKYVSTSREYSDALVAKAARLVLARNPGACALSLDEIVAKYRKGELWNVRGSFYAGPSAAPCNDLSSAINVECSRRACCLPVVKKAAAMAEEV